MSTTAPAVKMRELLVSDIMTKGVKTIDGSATVADAIKKMRAEKITSLIVNRRNKSDAWAIVTVKDVVTKIVDPGRDPREVKVFEIMTKPLIFVSPGLAVKYCARLMKNAGIRRAPVFDGTDLVGVVSHIDIFRAIEV